MNNLVQNNDVTAICCPRSNAEFVRLNVRIEEWNLFRDFWLCIAASNDAQVINQAD